jgi:nitroimidazol reductase NimA-like FMN-containing flavoprotein (pyridoxamine 5'-phosphate oxidase superfamily)
MAAASKMEALSLRTGDLHHAMFPQGVIAYLKLFLTHAALAPAINQMGGREAASLAPCFSMRCVVPEIIPPTERTRVVREAHRGAYDRETIDKILDEAYVCHIGFAIEGQPFVIPTLFARIGDAIYFHGSAASRMLRNASEGISVCITVTLTDGFVLARSVFNHSMNYRSVVALGKATLVSNPEEKLEALRAFTEKILPGRWNDARQPNEKELKATSILRLPLTEVSAKIRVGPPEDDAPDVALPIWAGVIPLQLTPGAPVRDEKCDPSIPLPAYAEHYTR